MSYTSAISSARCCAASAEPSSYPPSMAYDKNFITQKADVGTYNYGIADHAHAVKTITSLQGNTALANACDLTYTHFLKAESITEGDKTLEYRYGSAHQRIKSTYSESGVTKQTKYYAFGGNYELRIDENGNESALCYLDGSVVFYDDQTTANNDKMLYLLRDHLGSIMKVVSDVPDDDKNYTIEETFSYDAWGRRRSATDWTYTGIDLPTYIDRGFTGHEMLDEFNLVNANGRIYDPVIAVFLSPDPYVQAQENSQNFNRYAYCLNNPLSYTDPSGKSFISNLLSGIFAPFRAFNSLVDYSNNLINGVENPGSAFNSDYILGNGYAGSPDISNMPLSSFELSPFEFSMTQDKDPLNSKQGFKQVKVEYGISLQADDKSWHYFKKGVYVYDVLITTEPETDGSAGGSVNTVGNIASGVGVAGTGLGMTDGTFRLAKSGKFSPGYYSSGWSTGNQYVKNLYSVSKVGKGLSTGASVLTTGIAYYQIANGTQQPITYADATVGTIGLSATIASYYSGIAIPYVGEFVAIYGTARLFWDLGQDYGPRTWYGKDDYKYFE